MNILVVTPLYPDLKRTRRIDKSWAIHNFVKSWSSSQSLLVINVNNFGLKKVFRFFTLNSRYLFEDVEVRGVPLLSIDFSGKKTTALSGRISERFLKKKGFIPDVIVSHCASGHLVAEEIKRYYPEARRVCGIHKADISKIGKGERDYLECFRHADLIACRSFSIERLYRRIMIPEPLPDNLFITHSGIGRHFVESPERIQKKSERMKLPVKIVTVSSLIPRKKIDVILRALAELKELEWEFQIIGEGRERTRLERLTEELNIRTRVSFAGYLKHPDVALELWKSDLFILVSERETFGLVYLEAMAKGCVVIGAKDWGIDGIVKNRENGFLCKTDSTADIRSILEEVLIFSQEEWQKYISASYDTALQYEEEKIADRYLARIAGIVNKSSSPSQPR